MADNYLEKHYAEYEERKKKWLLKKGKHIAPEDKDPWSDL
ncbi:MAG: dehydrogenase [Paludibacteraceae bacterium]|nr:dehydrogenase [Paludibacteraceae bacterium]